MKQLLFLLLFPCLALAQYQGNANQKITLGEQTTADGLVWRGVASIDTVTATSKITRANKQDTSAFILLDTVTNLLWHYKIGSNAWTQAGGSTLTNAVTGTGTTTYIPKFTGTSTIGNSNLINNASGNLGLGVTPSAWLAGLSVIQGTSSLSVGNSGNGGMNILSNGYYGSNWTYVSSAQASWYQQIEGKHAWYSAPSGTANNPISFTQAMTLNASGNLSIGNTNDTYKLDVSGTGRFTSVGAGTFSNNLNITSDGTLTTATSDEKYKYNILPITYGLNTILQLKPVNFQWIEGEEQDLGFIAQDVAEIIPEAVNTNWNSDLLMRYESIIPILTKAIQEQQALIKALEQRILTLENK